jgi:hypothetical protein
MLSESNKDIRFGLAWRNTAAARERDVIWLVGGGRVRIDMDIRNVGRDEGAKITRTYHKGDWKWASCREKLRL